MADGAETFDVGAQPAGDQGMRKAHLAVPLGQAIAVGVYALAVGGISLTCGDEPEQLAFFESRIRPVLIRHCYACHAGPDADAGLRLDWRDGWFHGGEAGPAIRVGDAEASRLWVAMSYQDPHLRMPPDQQLPPQVLEDFRRWINSGAADPRGRPTDEANGPPATSPSLSIEEAQNHWAYRPRQTIDTSPAQVQQFHPIDWLLQRERAALGIEPLAAAPPATLWRRLHLDLSGLPPTYESLQSLPTSPEAFAATYRQQVEHLLAERAFGETFARHWLDVVRYADSVTLRGLVLPQAWRYRDYVIQSFHEDRSFGQMIVEQIAGDLLPAPENAASGDAAAVQQWQLQRIATTFLTLGNTNLETQDKRLLEFDYLDEQLDVIGQAFLGQTIACARCHDHKFDPIPTRDYYALAGIMDGASGLRHDNVSTWVEQPLPLSPQETAVYDQLEQELVKVSAQVNELRTLTESHREPRRRIPLGSLPGIVVDDSQAQLVGTWTLSQHSIPFVGDGYQHDENREQGRKTATFHPPSVPAGNYEVRIAYTAGENRASNALFEVFSADGQTTKRVNQRQKPPIDGLWYSLGDFRFESAGQAFVMISNQDADGHVIVDAVQWLPRGKATNHDRDKPTGVADMGNSAGDSPGAASSSPPATVDTDDSLDLWRRLQSLEQQQQLLRNQLEQRPKSMTVISKPETSDLPILIRGDHKRPGAIAPRGFLAAIRVDTPPPIPTPGDARLALGQWIAADDHPLTARVYANRVWGWLVGRPLVPTSNNFGTTGEPPTHPALLDWLAEELIRSGWSTKHLVRLIVTSAAYQQAVPVDAPPQGLVDPENRSYWRAQRRRLSVEALRDAMLFCSGELEPSTGGSQIPIGTIADFHYRHEFRGRSVYQPVFRNALPDLYPEFDFADPSRSVGQRDRSTTASQALALANSPWVTARAAATARRIRGELRGAAGEATPRQLAEQAYRRCLQRDPHPQELDRCESFLQPVAGQPAPSAESAEADPLVDLVQALFGSLEFRFLD
jgi:hypothetical protein